jgi:prepilin-type N-terminal cleavage/methylation domain-containing protein
MKKTPLAFTPRFIVFRGFTLMETVIAIGVLAVLLTGFIAVFTPATQGIRRSISSQQADRLTSTMELELVTVRSGQAPATATTGFGKAFAWLKEGNDPANAIFVYQYRGNPAIIRADGTPEPMKSVTGQPGTDYIVQSMARRVSEAGLAADLKAIEGSIFYVNPTQLVYQGNQMILGTPGTISHTEAGAQVPATDAAGYKDAVIAFSAEFYSVPSKAIAYLQGASFKTRFNDKTKKPVFTRNLAVRR